MAVGLRTAGMRMRALPAFALLVRTAPEAPRSHPGPRSAPLSGYQSYGAEREKGAEQQQGGGHSSRPTVRVCVVWPCVLQRVPVAHRQAKPRVLQLKGVNSPLYSIATRPSGG